MSALSANTQAILLLTAPLLLDRSTESHPLTVKEYNRLASELRNMQRQPSDFLGHDADALIQDCKAIVDGLRLRRLLDRGFLLSQSIERWSTRAIWVFSRADAEYPRRLKARLRDLAPPVLYGCGDLELLNTRTLAVVGSRHVDDDLIRYTESVGRLAAGAETTIVSGAARGIDEAAMRGAIRANGRVVGVHADGLEKSATNRENRNAIRDRRLVLVSPHDPMAGFNVGNAMQRNKVIYAFANAALVVNADVGKGGTWAGATEQLEKYQFLPVYVRSTGEPNEALQALRAMGAKPWPNPQTASALQATLDEPPDESAGDSAIQPELPLSTPAAESGASSKHDTITESHVAALHEQASAAIEQLSRVLRALPDESYQGFLDEALVGPLLKAIQDPAERSAHKNLAQFFMARRHRLAFAERLRLALHRSYAFEASTNDGKPLFVSVSAQQWFEDGVMHTEGDSPHEGLMLLFHEGRIKVATAARDAKKGDELGPSDFNFIELDEANARQKAIGANTIADVEQPLRDLETLIARRDNNESSYQDLFERYPWILGAEYAAAFRHQALDDKNVPDFLARRSRDGRHDIVEIKPPFLEINRRDGTPNATCQEAIAQSERYLDFARNNTHYLAQRRLAFDAPKCWLIAGYDVTDGVLDEFKRKQRLNPALHILTYNDLLAYVHQTVELIKHLRDGALTIVAAEPSSS